jgi:hypothetical protein
MKHRRRFVYSFTALFMCLLLVCAGCGSGVSDTVEVDAGEFIVENVNQLTPGDAPAMQRLAAEIKGNPEATMYTVKWKNVHTLGSTYLRKYIFDRKAGTLTDNSENIYPLYYTGVTVDMIDKLAASSGTADGLPALGAQRVQSLPEKAQ